MPTVSRHPRSLSLSARVAALTAASLIAVQAGLGYFFVTTLDQSIALHRESTRGKVQTAVTLAVTGAASSQRAGLEVFADMGRQQNAVIEGGSRGAASGGLRSFWERLRARPSTHDVRLSSRVSGIREIRGGGTTLWYLLSENSPETLKPELLERVRNLEAATKGTATRLLCGSDTCDLVTVRPFQTQDHEQVIALSVVPLASLIAPLTIASGTGSSFRIVPAGEARTVIAVGPADPTLAEDPWTPAISALGDVPVDGGPIQFRADTSAEVDNLLRTRHIYVQVAMLGVLLTLLLIVVSLRRVVNRVNQLSGALPLLTERRYALARERLGRAETPGFFGDETDELVRIAHGVTTQLETMSNALQVQNLELRNERDHLSLLLDAVPACVLLIDHDTRMRSVNPQTARLVGRDAADLMGELVASILHVEDRDAMLARLEKLRRGLPDAPVEPYNFIEARIGDAQGGFHAIQWRLVVMSPSGGGERRVLALGLDVTTLRESERRLQWLGEHDLATSLLSNNGLVPRLCGRAEAFSLVVAAPQRRQVFGSSFDEAGEQRLMQHLGAALPAASPPQIENWAHLGDYLFVASAHGERAAIEAGMRDLDARVAAVPFQLDGRSYDLGLQWGFVQVPADCPAEAARELLLAAEPVLAKTTVQEKWIAWQEIASTRERDHRAWVQRIDDAIREERVALFYQPIFHTADLRLSHSEALVRLIDGDGTVMLPGLFLQHAERSGQMRELERIVVRKALAKAKALQDAGTEHVIAVNLSAHSLDDGMILDAIEDAMTRDGLHARGLMLEIVETEAIQNLEKARATMQRFKALGVAIALDDFGIGFTSFEYLRELPFDYVKIDKSFVMKLASQPGDQRLIASINELVVGLGRKTIAEGVEDAQSLALLRQMNVHAVQGFHLGKAEALLRVEVRGAGGAVVSRAT